MRLTSLTLQNYGNFQAETVVFDPAPGVVDLIVAPNGAGKSVLRMAFGDLLFGIGMQTPMNFRYGYAGMRIAVQAMTPDGQRVAFGRVRGRGNTLVDGAGAPLDPGRVTALLGGTDRAQLERLFALDTERLRQGEAELLASNGALADALEAGAGGVRQARLLREALEQGRDALAPARKSSQRPFYLALDRYVDSRRRLSASVLKPDQWEKQRQDLDQHQTEQETQNRAVEQASAEIARLERIRRVTPWLRNRDAAAAWLDAHPGAPTLDPALQTRLDDLRAAIVLDEERVRVNEAGLADLARQLEAITVDTTLLAEAVAIDALTDPAGAARKALADLPSRDAELQACTTRIRDLLRILGSDLPPDRSAEAIPAHSAITRARRLITSHGGYRQAVQGAPGRIAAQERAVRELAAALAAMAAPEDHQALDALVQEIRAEGDPARQRAAAEAASGEAAAERDSALARVPGWTGPAEDLARIAPMPPETYQAVAADLDAARTAAASREEQAQAARLQLDVARDRLAGLTGPGILPDAAALRAARGHRDALWHLVYRRAFTAEPVDAAAEAALSGGRPLALAFERATEDADRLADRRVAEAAAIEQALSAQRAVAEAEATLAAATQQAAAAQDRLATAGQGWVELCAPLPLPGAPSLREVLAFLTARERMLDARRTHQAADQALAGLLARHAAWSAALATLLGLADDPGLVAGLARADAATDAVRKAETDRATLHARHQAEARALADAKARQAEAEAALATWQADWDQVLVALGRPAGEDPAVTDEQLQVIANLGQARKDADTLATRVRDMRADNSRFRAAVGLLAASVAPDQARADPFAAVTAMRQRLQAAREHHRSQTLLQSQHDAGVAALAGAREALATQRATLAGLLVVIGADTTEAAQARLALAAEAARHAAALAAAEADLVAGGDGLAIDALRADAASLPPEEVEGRIAAIGQARAAAQNRAQEEAAQVSALRQQMEREAADASARDAAADQQAAIATIGRVLDEALVLHAAAELLRGSMAAVEQTGDSAAMRRITRHFAALTDGAYTRVMAEAEDGTEPRLLLVQRAFPDERQAVRDLSEGTRDQLYLALRLAAIETQAATTPLPFIGDDILQTFDDARALAALRALGDVSRTVQVILLTHHQHLGALAERLPEGMVRVSRLGG